MSTVNPNADFVAAKRTALLNENLYDRAELVDRIILLERIVDGYDDVAKRLADELMRAYLRENL